MKLWATAIKSMKENLRDWKVLILALTLAPFFVLLMYLFYGGAPTVYNIGILNLDQGRASSELIQKLQEYKGAEDLSTFKLIRMNSEVQIAEKVKTKDIDLGIRIPENYSEQMMAVKEGREIKEQAEVGFFGSSGNMRYTLAAIMSSDIISKQELKETELTLPLKIVETFSETKQARNEFEGYVPGMISLGVLMILFTATASIVNENDKNTIIRLKLSRLGAFNFLAGISIVQALIATLAIVISYYTAIGLGYKPAGEFGPLLIVGILSSFSMVAVSLIVASYLDTIFDVLTIGCFPFFILMFFSGCMFPMPKIGALTLAGHTFGPNDILPLTHTANAFNKILNFGAGLSAVSFDIFMIVALTVVYFAIGMLLYQKRKLSKA